MAMSKSPLMSEGYQGVCNQLCPRDPGQDIWWVLETQISKSPLLEGGGFTLSPALLFTAILMILLLLCH